MSGNLFCLRAAVAARKSLLLRSKCITGINYYSDEPPEKDALYKTLGISSSATQIEIKKAFYDLTLKYHPDRNENSDLAATKFREVAEAYEILGNFVRRKKYDKGLPLEDVKKAVKKSVDHKVKYQAFFDSRAVQPTSTVRGDEVDSLRSTRKSDYVKDALDRAEKELNPKNIGCIQNVVALYFAVILYFSHGV